MSPLFSTKYSVMKLNTNSVLQLRMLTLDLRSSPSTGGVLSTNTRSGSLLRDDSVEPICVAALSMATVGTSSVSVAVDSLALVVG